MHSDWGMTSLSIIWGVIEALLSVIFMFSYPIFRKLWAGCLLSLVASGVSILVWRESYYERWGDGGKYGVECPDVLISCDNYHVLYELSWWLYGAGFLFFIVALVGGGGFSRWRVVIPDGEADV
ncbi:MULTISPECIES: hypothetical protein [Escherichia]|uniref:hypothetical protein n=1 Tax=Escherichia TaxID=561 RepID=UPI000CF79F18|nr:MULTISPECIES: hypothetical protein [Escherichia]MDQ9276310.1 hypothetical protein [Escherichia marmotae]